MKIHKIISEWGRKALSRSTTYAGSKQSRPAKGYKRVMAVVSFGNGVQVTRHLDLSNGYGK